MEHTQLERFEHLTRCEICLNEYWRYQQSLSAMAENHLEHDAELAAMFASHSNAA